MDKEELQAWLLHIKELAVSIEYAQNKNLSSLLRDYAQQIKDQCDVMEERIEQIALDLMLENA